MSTPLQAGDLCRLRAPRPGEFLSGCGNGVFPVRLMYRGPIEGAWFADDQNGHRFWWLENDLEKIDELSRNQNEN